MGKVIHTQSGDIGLKPLYVPSKRELKDAVILDLETKTPGKLKKVPKMFLTDKTWVKIDDEDMFRKLFPTHEHYVLRDFEMYAVYVSKESERFKNVEELKVKAKELLDKRGEEALVFIAKSRKDIQQNAEDYLLSMNFYQLESFMSEMDKVKSPAKKNVTTKDSN